MIELVCIHRLLLRQAAELEVANLTFQHPLTSEYHFYFTTAVPTAEKHIPTDI